MVERAQSSDIRWMQLSSTQSWGTTAAPAIFPADPDIETASNMGSSAGWSSRARVLVSRALRALARNLDPNQAETQWNLNYLPLWGDWQR